MTDTQRTLKTRLWLSAIMLLFVADPSSAQSEIPITTDSEAAKDHFMTGQQYLDNIRFDDAREAFNKAIQADPNFAYAHLHRAWVGTSSDDFYGHLGHAVDLADHASASERLAIMASKASADNDQMKAIELWKQLVEMNPNAKRAHLLLANAYSGQDMDKEAIASLKRANKIDPEWAPPYNALGYLYRNDGAYAEAEKSFKKYVSLLPEEPNPYDSLADLYTKMARHEEAIQNYQKAVELGNFSVSQRKIGDNYVMMGQFDKGRSAYLAALDMEKIPTAKVTDLNRITYSYVLEGRMDDALAASDRAIELAKASNLPEREAGIHAPIRSDIYMMMGDLDAAERSIQACRTIVNASDLDSGVREDYERLVVWQEGVVAAKRGNFTRAQAKIDQYYALMDADDDVNQVQHHHALVGLVKLEEGDYKAAVKHLKLGDQDDPYVVYHLALAENAAGNPKGATDLLTKVSDWNENSLSYALTKGRADNELDKMRAGLSDDK